MFEKTIMSSKSNVLLKSNEGLTSLNDAKDFREIRFGVIILLILYQNNS